MGAVHFVRIDGEDVHICKEVFDFICKQDEDYMKLEAEVERLREWCTLRHTILHRVKGWCLEISDEVETFEDAVYLARKCLDQISQGEIVRPMEDKNAQ